MQGWTLDWIIEHDEAVYGVPLSDHILFPPMLDKWHGVPYKLDEIEEWRMTRPPEPRQRGALFAGLDFITRYCLADLYVDVSSAEGHGLSVLEAAACGVPCISVNDGMARTEVHSKYCHMLEPVYNYDTWHISSTLALVDPRDVAAMILELKENDELRNRFAPAQAHIKEDLPWARTADFFIDLFRRAYAAKTRR
jgi:glycosyltransferase involved in cell wall biosynthesis